MDGRGIKVSSPPGRIIRPEDTIILRGEGMPVFKQPDQKGDLFVVLEIEMPSEQWLKTVDREVSVSIFVLMHLDVGFPWELRLYKIFYLRRSPN